MWNLLVVEDEPIVRMGLRTMIDWESQGIRWSAEASNGMEALKVLNMQDIQLVITDIRMPGIDGIELAKEIKLRHPHIEMIFLTSFDDLQYAKEALRIGVSDYLHKPTMDEQEIIEALQRAVEKLAKRSVASANPYGENERDQFLCTMLDEYVMQEHWHDKWRLFVPSEVEESYTLVIFRFVYEREQSESDPRLDSSRFRSVRYFLQEYISSDWGGVLFTRDDKEIIWLATENGGKSSNGLVAYLEYLEKKVYEYLQLRLVYAYGEQAYRGGGQMPRAYLETLAAFPMNKDSLSVTVRKVQQYVDDHYAEDISLAKGALHANVSVGHLSRIFLKEMGENFSDYLTRKRIQHAKMRLRETNMKVYEIASEIGYANPHYFSRLFKETVGVTPLEYRNK